MFMSFYYKRIESNMVLPPYKIAESIYNLGEFLLRDDKHDIGYFTYYNRPHIYNGELKKDHPSPLHHWPVGIALMFVGQLLGTAITLNEMKDGAIEATDSNKADEKRI